MSDRARREYRREKKRREPSEDPEPDQFVDDWSEHVLDKIVARASAGHLGDLKSDLRGHLKHIMKRAKAHHEAQLANHRSGSPDLQFHQLIQKAVGNLDQPRRDDETSSVYAQRQAAKHRQEKHDEKSSRHQSRDPRDLRIADTFRERVSIQQIHNQDMREAGLSKFSDQGISFDRDR
jgi:hypothetical protein